MKDWTQNAAILKADREQNANHPANRTGIATLHTRAAKTRPDANAEFSFQFDLRRRELGGNAPSLEYPEAEYQFALDKLGRKWAFDFAWPKQKLALEIDGQVHRIDGRWRSDMEKFNAATLLGWKVMHYMPSDVRSGRALREIEFALAGETEGLLKLRYAKGAAL